MSNRDQQHTSQSYEGAQTHTHAHGSDCDRTAAGPPGEIHAPPKRQRDRESVSATDRGALLCTIDGTAVRISGRKKQGLGGMKIV